MSGGCLACVDLGGEDSGSGGGGGGDREKEVVKI